MLKVDGIRRKFLLITTVFTIFSNKEVLQTVAGNNLEIPGWDCSNPNDKFICDNQVECIPDSWRCNGYENCDDGEDERNCAGFHCTDSERYLPDNLVCDGYADCADLSDETGCVCLSTQTRCSSGIPECIANEKVCNSENDCQDGSDEQACPCNLSQFECDTNRCVDAIKVCDGVEDCSDGSDEDAGRCEASCEHRCTTGSTYLGHTPCITSAQLCDSMAECADHSDESKTNCTGCAVSCMTDAGDVPAGTLPRFQCFDSAYLCDGHRDCIDYSDETDSSCTCPWDNTKCTKTGRCVPPANKCDAVNDCGDNGDWQDECFCNYPDYVVFVCGSMCLAPWQRCDGVDDCGDNSDEQACETIGNNCNHHPNGTFACENPENGVKECIESSLRCDGNSDCYDGSDERLCDQRCASDETRCATGASTLPNSSPCIPNSMWCDGTAQCLDRSDETYEMCYGMCDYHPRIPVTRCPSMADDSVFICVTLANACNRIDDCQGAVDESDCCGSNEFRCRGTGSCIIGSWVCDGTSDCDEGTDEDSCAPCPDDHFHCLNDLCIPNRYFCDEYEDCGDGSDESWGCEPLPPTECAHDQFKCWRIDECIALTEVCDNVTNCEDGSDELTVVCSDWNTITTTTTASPPKDENWKIIVGSVGVSVFVLVVVISSIVAVKSMMKGKNRRRVRGVPTTTTTTTHARYNNRYGVSTTDSYTKPSTFPKAKASTSPTTYPTRSSVGSRPASTKSQPMDTKLSNGTPTGNAAVNVDSGLTPVEVTPSAPPTEMDFSSDIPDPPSYETLYKGPVDPTPVDPVQASEVGKETP